MFESVSGGIAEMCQGHKTEEAVRRVGDVVCFLLLLVSTADVVHPVLLLLFLRYLEYLNPNASP